ncbi:HEAT repeat domain-containing protein [Candidatus Parcubacteria bacterium]|nr:HEAT repeat domain-containing protein [Candidatus Parcubacteria bacterium]
MKKVIKIILIVIMCFVVAYGIKIAYGVWVFNNVSAEDQLKIIESKHERCLAEAGDDCEDILIWGLNKTLETQAQELMVVVLDKTISEDERWFALQLFYTLSKNDGEFLSKETGEFYFAIANDKENPKSLRETAAKYLLGAKSKDKAVKELQTKVLESPEASSEYKREAIKAVASSGDEDAIDILLKTLEDTDPSITLKASGSLLGQWPEIKDRVPDLLKFAFDETKPLLARSEIIGLFESFAIYYDYKDSQAIKELPALLNHSHYGIRSEVARTLKVLTGKEYQIKPGTEDEVLEMFGLE